MPSNVSREKSGGGAPLRSLIEKRPSLGGGLYLAWRLRDTDANSAQETKERLTRGEKQNLYRLCSWVVVDGEAQALLTPTASFEEITTAIWRKSPEPSDETLRTRWISSSQLLAELTREIEIVPVQLGLARRPEEWPFSSASHE